jgi:phosphatidyl-myo-inositol dimannoside synthase
MNVCFLTVDFPPAKGGMATYCFELAKNLSVLKNNVTVLAQAGRGASEFDKTQGFKTIRMKPITNGNAYDNLLLTAGTMFFYALYAILKFKCRKLYVHSWSPCGLAAFLIRKIFGVPYYVSAHGMEVMQPLNSGRATKVMLRVLNNASRIFSSTNYLKQKLIDIGVRGDLIMVVPLGADPEVFKCGLDTAEIKALYSLTDRKVILSVGRLQERKGFDITIASMPAVLEKIPNALYLICGCGPFEAELREQAAALGLNEKVVFAGFLEDSELPKYYNTCDIFVMPSRVIAARGDIEGFGIVYLEANACCKPVIGGNAGGVPEAVSDGKTGLLVDPTDKKALADAIISLLSDTELSNRLGVGGRQRVENDLNWRSCAAKIRAFMEA